MPIPAAYGSSRQQKKKQRPFPTYAGTPYSFTQGTSVTITPTIKGDGPSSASISPTLPSGLSLNTTTLVISGTPSESSSQTTYTVTATNAGGASQVQLQLTIVAAAPTVTITSTEYRTLSYGNTGSNTPDPSLVLSETFTGASPSNASAERIGSAFSVADPQKVLTQAIFAYATTNLSAGDLPADGACEIAVEIAFDGKGPEPIWIWRPDTGGGTALDIPENPGDFTPMTFGSLNRDDILGGRLDLMPSASTGFAHYVAAESNNEASLLYRIKIRLAGEGQFITSATKRIVFNSEGQVPVWKQYLAAAMPTISNVTLIAFSFAAGGDPGTPAPLDPSQQETVVLDASSSFTLQANTVALFKDSAMEKLYYAWSVTYNSRELTLADFNENDVLVNFTVNNPAASNKMQYHRDEFTDDVLFGTPTSLENEYAERDFCIDGTTPAFLLPGFGGINLQPQGAPGNGPYQVDNSIIFNASAPEAPPATFDFSLTFNKANGEQVVTDVVTITVPSNATRDFLL